MSSRILKFLIIAIVAATLALPAVADPRNPGKIVRLKGWVVDDHCGRAATNAEAAAQVHKCHEAGWPLIFWAGEGKFYPIVDQEAALERVGREWSILGSLDNDGKLQIGSWIDPERPRGVEAPSAATAVEPAPTRRIE